ncbi:MAG TPA: hypothetical protein VGV10_07590 [Thermoleophilaceae bacterium]|nr:hypothetical protein [Thermoleophilaceae bacterium]
MIRNSGDPERLLAAKREHIDPVMERKAPEYGNLLHVAARTPDGVLVLNLWKSEEGSAQAFQDPEIQQARQAMMDSGAAAGPPEMTHYEVVDYHPSMG